MSGIMQWFRGRHLRKLNRKAGYVLDALRIPNEMSGYELTKATGLGAATIYPLLVQMEADGRIVSRWEVGPEPRRRLYRRGNGKT